tara:strand:+ start:556 stop:663 length:108 start_codon:yes stop_codon:yes gene_type:complete
MLKQAAAERLIGLLIHVLGHTFANIDVIRIPKKEG